MAADVLLGIDLGTTVLKLCAFESARGSLLAEATRRLPIELFPGGGRETRLEALDRAFVSAAREVRTALGSRAWARLAGIGLGAQGGSSIIAERATGRARTPMVLWNDARAAEESSALAREAPRGLWRRCLLSDFPPAGLGRLVWLRARRPELFDDAHIHVGAGEYLFFRLTGLWRQDAGNAIQVGSYNAAARRLDTSLLQLVDLPVSFFAPLRCGHGITPLSREGARVVGASQGVPVAGPYIDQEASYCAAAGVTRHPLDCSLGTAWVGNFVLPESLRGSSPVQLVIPAPVGKGAFVILPVPTGNAAWEWSLKELLGAADIRRALPRAAAVLAGAPAPPEGLVALPWLTQANPLNAAIEGAGVFLGIGERTTREEMLRALAAGMTFELVRVLRAVAESGAIDGVVLSGGTSRGEFFRQAIATLFAPLPCFVRPSEASPAARGAVCAFSTEVAAAGAQRLRPPGRSLQKALQRAYAQYLEAFARVYADVPAGRPYRVTRST